MRRPNTDTLAALLLLLLCATFIAASFQIRETSFGQMGSEVWPRIVLGVLTALTLIYLAQSLRLPAPAAARDQGRLRAWLARYRNALWCYALFLGFLLTLPVFGMLIGGALFVFCMLSVLGAPRGRDHLRHAIVAILAVGLMWSIFTFGLNVILPQGMIFTIL